MWLGTKTLKTTNLVQPVSFLSLHDYRAVLEQLVTTVILETKKPPSITLYWLIHKHVADTVSPSQETNHTNNTGPMTYEVPRAQPVNWSPDKVTWRACWGKLKLSLPVCNAKRCGEHWGWTFSSHQCSEHFSSVSQNTPSGALAWRGRNVRVELHMVVFAQLWIFTIFKTVDSLRGIFTNKFQTSNFAFLMKDFMDLY